MKKLERRINKYDYERLEALCATPGKEEEAYLLADVLKRVKPSLLVAHNSTPPQVVTMNSRVLVQNLRTKQRIEVTLVFPDEADEIENKISILEPLGAALLGYGIGETVQYATPAGSVWMKIERVCYQPETAGNYTM